MQSHTRTLCSCLTIISSPANLKFLSLSFLCEQGTILQCCRSTTRGRCAQIPSKRTCSQWRKDKPLSWLILATEKQSLWEPLAVGWRKWRELQVQQSKNSCFHCGSHKLKSFPTLATRWHPLLSYSLGCPKDWCHLGAWQSQCHFTNRVFLTSGCLINPFLWLSA